MYAAIIISVISGFGVKSNFACAMAVIINLKALVCSLNFHSKFRCFGKCRTKVN